MTQKPNQIAGIVLAGGRATRLGGGDKPLREVRGRPMLDHVLERLRPQVSAVAISANGDPSRFAAHRLPILADMGPGGQVGPLSGILSGLRWARSEGFGRLLTVAGDTPFFPIDLGVRLGEAVGGHRNSVGVAASGGRSHPVFALWPVSLEADLTRFLSRSTHLSVAAFIEGHDAISVDFPITTAGDIALDPFFNVNTPEDIAMAEVIAVELER
jgi:molybdopterin-guanine dinucleotide biosynthesis protein A